MADDDNDEFRLSTFLDLVRDDRDLDGEANVQQIVSEILNINTRWEVFILDGPLGGNDFEDQAFDALISSGRIWFVKFDGLVLQGEHIQNLLERVIANMKRRWVITLNHFSMSDVEAGVVFSCLSRCENLAIFAINLINEGSAPFWDCLTRFIRESSSLKVLLVSMLPNEVLSVSRFQSLCESIAKSTKLEALVIFCPPVNDEHVGLATESLTRAIVDSSSLNVITIDSKFQYLPLNGIQEALLQNHALQNMDWTFRLGEDIEGNPELTVTRSNPWKRCLVSDSIPLALWPSILAKANTWNQETSHSSRDALYFLIREKNDVLFQNIHKRRIRKRKRYQCS